MIARSNSKTLSPDNVLSVTFLLSINNTEQGCIYTTKSPPISPKRPYNKSQPFSVGNCDRGPLIYDVTTEKCTASLMHSQLLAIKVPP